MRPVSNSKYPILCTMTFCQTPDSRASGACTLLFPHTSLENMLTKCKNIGDTVKSLIAGFWITFSVYSVGVHGQEGKIHFVVASAKFKKVVT